MPISLLKRWNGPWEQARGFLSQDLQHIQSYLNGLPPFPDHLDVRAEAIVSSATPAIDTDEVDFFSITHLTENIQSFSMNLFGDPVEGQELVIRILDDGVAHNITWGPKFIARGAALPATSKGSTTEELYAFFIYDAIHSAWACVYINNVTAIVGGPPFLESDITGLVADLAATEKTANKNIANGYAGLDSGGKLPDARLSSNVPLLNAANIFTANNAFVSNQLTLGPGGTGASDGFLILNGSNAVSQGAIVGFYRNAALKAVIGTHSRTIGTNLDDLTFYTPATIPMRFYVAGTENVKFHSSLGVSLGTTTDPGANNVQVGNDLFLGGELHMEGTYPLAAGSSGNVRVLSTGSTVTAATIEGLRDSVWSFFDTVDDEDGLLMSFDISYLPATQPGTLRKTGMAFRQYLDAYENGGDSSALLISSTGGGNGITVYKNYYARPSGERDWSTYTTLNHPDNGGVVPLGYAIETGTSGGNYAVLVVAGIINGVDSPHNAGGIQIDLGAGAKGIIVLPIDNVFDTRVAYSIGNVTSDGPDTNLTYSVLLNGSLMHNGYLAESGIVSAAQITSNQNNYNPTGLSGARILRLSSDASRDITGIVAQANHMIWVFNAGGFNIVFKHASGSSAAGNMFICPGAADYTLTPGSSLQLYYDTVSAFWLVG